MLKSGRVVPVKVTIYDNCAQAYVTDPSTLVSSFLSAGGLTGTTGDAVEVCANEGASESNTLYFRWTTDSTTPGGGFWIYNRYSRTALSGAAFVIGATYRLDVLVGPGAGVKVTNNTWALLTAVR